ncbi:MAG: Rieske 2Fe-2S domain-containing protein, partial [Bacteroidota bacterium]
MQAVLKATDLPVGTTKQIELNDRKILLVNVAGAISAVESKCSHFGLPLENASLHGHSLRCPFHHACFDVRNGKQLEAPGLDGIATFTITSKV